MVLSSCCRPGVVLGSLAQVRELSFVRVTIDVSIGVVPLEHLLR